MSWVFLYRVYSQDPQAETSALWRRNVTHKEADLLQEKSKQQHSKHSRKEEQPKIIFDHYSRQNYISTQTFDQSQIT